MGLSKVTKTYHIYAAAINDLSNFHLKMADKVTVGIFNSSLVKVGKFAMSKYCSPTMNLGFPRIFFISSDFLDKSEILD